ncbi:MAG TPA: apolipoprotein N-acyltransferase [Acidimicrobiia bacterium]|nr:apolipoprotein N-acyltransferase [Acidimicrobiia bacterium]
MRDSAAQWFARLAVGAMGAILALAMPAPAWWWLGWIGVAPIVWLVATAPTRREAMLRSWLGGTAFLLVLHYWLIPHMGVFTVPVAAFVGLFWLPLGLAVWSYLGEPFRTGARPYLALLVVPSVWVAIEGIRSWEYLGGSWGMLGLSQWQVGPVLQTAALGGVWLLSFGLVVTNVGLTTALLPGMAKNHRRVALGAALLVPALMVVYGASRPDAAVTGEVTLAGVQTGVIDSNRERLQAHLDLTRTIEGTVDFVVWGQSSVAYDPEQDPEVERLLREVSGEAEAPVLVNIDARVGDGRIRKVFVHYTPEGPVAAYAKQRLVPFGEYIPLRPLFGWVADFTEAAVQDRARGEELTTMQVAGVEVGPLVSYESTFPAMRRRLAQLGAAVTVVQGGTWTFQGTWAQPQQASHEAVRAVATGRPAVLVAVSGTSSAFDARGRLLAWYPADWEGAFMVDIPLSAEDTPYVRFGDWMLWLAWTATAGAGTVGLTRRLSR